MRKIPQKETTALLLFCLATVFLIALERDWAGGVVWLAALGVTLRSESPAFRRRMSALLLCIALLAFAPIHTDTSTGHIVTLGGFFLAVIVLPPAVLWRSDRQVFRYRFWPHRFRWWDLFYVAISIPLAKYAIAWYFDYNAFMPTQWFLPAEFDRESIYRLFLGINGVGIWDELFFVNTVFVLLRSMVGFRSAILAQAVVYTSVLYSMAFIGIGPLLVFLFALTQGSMFEESENLLYVLVVHLIVDYFLFGAIVAHYYPGDSVTGVLLH